MKDKNILINNGVDLQKSLELFVDMETYEETLRDFLAAIDEKVANLNKSKEETDMPAYAIDVHSLKSDARYLGFNSLAELALELEMKSKENDAMYVLDNHDRLLAEVNKFVNLSKTYLGMEVAPVVEQPKVETAPKNETILVVDDSNLVANFVKKIFDDRYEVLIANDGLEAIRYVTSDETGKIKCCLLDLNMPNVNGFEVLEYFKNNNLFVRIPVSVITGNDTKEQVETAFTYPIVDLLSKPFNERDVKRIIEKTIGLGN